MGAWGIGIFDNDPAGDWACDLEDSDFSYVRDTIESVLGEADDYLEVDVGCMGLAACEVIARLKGNPGETSSDEGMTAPSLERIDAWVKANPQTIDEQLVQSCLTVIDAVKGKKSESAELWEETEDYADWLKVADDLRSRLTQ